MKTIFTTPEGTRDILFEQCEGINRSQSRLCNLFRNNGYREVKTPLIEYYECFSTNGCKIDQQQMYKFTDNNGRLLVLRPDCTVPIARMTAMRLREHPKPLRLFYCQNVMRLNRRYAGVYDESFQAGIELLGDAGKLSDLEVLALASEILEDYGDFILEIGHIDIFNRIITALGTDRATAEQIRECIEQKNTAALSDVLTEFGENPAAKWLLKLSLMFGGKEVLEEAKQLSAIDGVGPILDYLCEVYRSLEALGLGDKVMFDFGMVSSVNYYTGIVFKGYLHGMNSEVLSGGRYDSLVGEYGLDIPAVGFAVNVESLPLPLENGQEIHPILIYAENGYEIEAIKYKRRFSQNTVCELANTADKKQALAYARARGIKLLHIVSNDVAIIEVGK